MLALNRLHDPEMYEVFKGASFRDSFPYEMLGEVRRLSAEGMAAKRAGNIMAFRVSAQGPECIPVLSVKYKNGEKWAVYAAERQQMSREEVLQARAASEADGRRPAPARKPDLKGGIPLHMWNKFPMGFKNPHIQDPDFRGRINFTNALVESGKTGFAKEEWDKELRDMKRVIDEYQGGDEEVFRIMSEIYEAYKLCFDHWVAGLK
jgi:hypothetical protein